MKAIIYYSVGQVLDLPILFVDTYPDNKKIVGDNYVYWQLDNEELLVWNSLHGHLDTKESIISDYVSIYNQSLSSINTDIYTSEKEIIRLFFKADLMVAAQTQKKAFLLISAKFFY